MNYYLIRVFIGFDQFCTTLVGGWPDETLSSYAYRLDRQGKMGGKVFRPIIDWLFAWQGHPMGHCHAAWIQETKRSQFPRELR